MSIKLLFADDSVTMQKVIQLTLENEKVDLLFASDGNKAFALAREERPDVVIADVYMPGLNGFQLCEKLKKAPETAAIPVILISGELENYDPGQGAAAGAAGHITKPFKSGEFIEFIKQYSGSAAGEAPKKAGRSKVKTVPAPVMDTEAEDEDEAFEPAVIELIDRAPGEPAGALDAGEELEVVDEDIDDLAEDLDELDEEIEGEMLEEDEAADEEEEPVAAAAPSSRKGKVPLDDVLPSTGEVDAAIALEAVRETTVSPAEDIRIYDDGAGDLAAEALGADLPSVHMEEGDDAARILADVMNVAEISPAERKEEMQRGDEALEDALDSLDRAATAPAPEKPAPAKPMAGRAAAHAPEDDLWDKSLDEVDQALAVTEAEREPVKEEGNDGIWNASRRDMDEAVRRAVETSAPAIIAAETGGLPPERLEELFRETAGRAVEEFIAARAEEVFRGEMRRAIDARFKESLDTQMEKVFREEIGRVMAAGFQKAMPRMLAIIDKITVQITPRIAQHMIKIAIERIKKGEIN